MPLSASATPCADNRHCSYSSLNFTAAWLSVQPSSTEVLMLLDRAACRPVASAASARHCPAIDCRVAMSTFTGPPCVPGPSRSAGTLGRGGHLSPELSTGQAVVHRSGDGGPTTPRRGSPCQGDRALPDLR